MDSMKQQIFYIFRCGIARNWNALMDKYSIACSSHPSTHTNLRIRLFKQILKCITPYGRDTHRPWFFLTAITRMIASVSENLTKTGQVSSLECVRIWIGSSTFVGILIIQTGVGRKELWSGFKIVWRLTENVSQWRTLRDMIMTRQMDVLPLG